jgi:hypothetical protein
VWWDTILKNVRISLIFSFVLKLFLYKKCGYILELDNPLQYTEVLKINETKI